MAERREQYRPGAINEINPTISRNIVGFAPTEVWQAALEAARRGGSQAEVLKPFKDWVERTYAVKTDLGDLYASWNACINTVRMAMDHTRREYDRTPEALNGVHLKSFLERTLGGRLDDGGTRWWTSSVAAAAGMMEPEIEEKNREFVRQQEAAKQEWRVTKTVPTRTPTGVGDAESYRITMERGDGTRRAVDISFAYDRSRGIPIGSPSEGLENRISRIESGIERFLKRRGIELTETRIHHLAEQVISDITAREQRERFEH